MFLSSNFVHMRQTSNCWCNFVLMIKSTLLWKTFFGWSWDSPATVETASGRRQSDASPQRWKRQTGAAWARGERAGRRRCPAGQEQQQSQSPSPVRRWRAAQPWKRWATWEKAEGTWSTNKGQGEKRRSRRLMTKSGQNPGGRWNGVQRQGQKTRKTSCGRLGKERMRKSHRLVSQVGQKKRTSRRLPQGTRGSSSRHAPRGRAGRRPRWPGPCRRRRCPPGARRGSRWPSWRFSTPVQSPNEWILENTKTGTIQWNGIFERVLWKTFVSYM